jgi:hypothetical protein
MVYASVAERMPESETSIPLVAYGRGRRRTPLRERQCELDVKEKAAHLLLCLQFDVISRTGVITETNNPRESVEAVADGDIKCLAKNTVSLTRVSNDLSVATRDIEDDRVLRPSD